MYDVRPGGFRSYLPHPINIVVPSPTMKDGEKSNLPSDSTDIISN